MAQDSLRSRGTLAEPLALLRPVLDHFRMPLALIVLVGLASALAESAGIGAILLLLSLLFGGEGVSAVIAQSPLAFLETALPGWLLEPRWIAILLALSVVLRLGLSALHGYISAAFAAHLGHETRTRLFRSTINMPFEKAQGQSWGELYSIIDEHSNAVPDALDALCNVIHALTVLLALSLLLLVAAPVQAAVGLVTVLLLHRIIATLRGPVERAGEESVAATRTMSEQLIRMLHAMRTFQILGLADRQGRRFKVASGRSAQAQLKADRLALVADPASHLAALVAVAVMALASGLFELGTGSLLLAIGLLYRLEPYVAMLQESQMELVEQTAALRIVARIPEPVEPPSRHALESGLAAIHFNEVTFAYGSRGTPVLDRMSIVIPTDGWTLVEGPSGAGKSTLVNLVLGLLQPSSGEIKVGNRTLAEIEPASWRRRIAVCGQDIELIGGTVRDNLLLGSGAPREGALERALEASGMHALIGELPEGLDTEVGERSLQLSGGQRQRLAIARAVLRDPDLLILDEATSMLDRTSQATIFANLFRIMKGRTVIAIGHNLSDLPPTKARFSLSQLDTADAHARRLANCA